MDTTGAFLVFRVERVEDAEHSFTAHGYEVILEIAPWMSLIHRDTSDAFAMGITYLTPLRRTPPDDC